MYHLCGEIWTVKRFGRWASSSFSLYLWESKDATRGLSQGMVMSEGNLEAAHGLGAEVARQRAEKKRVRVRLPTVSEDESELGAAAHERPEHGSSVYSVARSTAAPRL